ncbi:MAG: hypothetical protein KDD92_04780 [Caldilineaceae bacterium]|nr:hypothetical protein [Caldilineaceae bacterium]
MNGTSSPIGTHILHFHRELLDDAHHRYRSWEHCYQFFSKRPDDTDLASLHLGFYLASWGMYRGSSFLLQKDYRIHLPVVEEILRPQYDIIRAVSLADLGSERGSALIQMILELVAWIKECYPATTGEVQGRANVTDTLATKILLGTLGCVPAYDRYVISGIKKSGLSYSYLNRKNFSALIAYCLRHRADFLEAQRQISAYGLDYPDMKLIDMYFWSVGASEDRREA